MTATADREALRPSILNHLNITFAMLKFDFGTLHCLWAVALHYRFIIHGLVLSSLELAFVQSYFVVPVEHA